MTYKPIFDTTILHPPKDLVSLKGEQHMAISKDLRNIQIALRAMPGLPLDTIPVIQLVCSNLQSIAEQVESLENIPLSTAELIHLQPVEKHMGL